VYKTEQKVTEHTSYSCRLCLATACKHDVIHKTGSK